MLFKKKGDLLRNQKNSSCVRCARKVQTRSLIPESVIDIRESDKCAVRKMKSILTFLKSMVFFTLNFECFSLSLLEETEFTPSVLNLTLLSDIRPHKTKNIIVIDTIINAQDCEEGHKPAESKFYAFL